MNRYILSPEAVNDIKTIRAYLEHMAGPHIAQSTLKKIKDASVFLSHTPNAGHTREDLTDMAVKFWPVFSYLIIYNPSTMPIEIVRIIHGSREVSTLLSRIDDL